MLPPTMTFLRILPLLAATVLAGCASLGYYYQAVSGQLEILARTRPIAELLDDAPVADAESPAPAPPLAPEVKARLAAIKQPV